MGEGAGDMRVSRWRDGLLGPRALLAAAACAALVTAPSLSVMEHTRLTAGGSTYSLGFSIEWGWDIVVGPDGSAYITGSTGSDFQTTPGAADETENGGSDAFVARIDPTGRLIYATVLGGRLGDDGTAVAVDSSGAAYVAGSTNGYAEFPTTSHALASEYRHTSDSSVGFLAKISPDGSTVEYSTLLPGVRYVHDLAVTPDGQAHLTGAAYPDFPPSPGAFGPTSVGSAEGYVATVNASGSGWSDRSFVGGSSDDFLLSIEVHDGATFLSGRTHSADFPTTDGAFDTVYDGSGDVFAMKIAGEAPTVEWSTFVGGRGSDQTAEYTGVSGLDVARDGSVYVTGMSDAWGFPVTPGASTGTPGDGQLESWLARLDPSGSTLTYAGFVPAQLGDMKVDRHGNFVVTARRAFDETFGLGVGAGPFAAVITSDGAVDSAMPLDLRPMDFDLDAAGTLYVMGLPSTEESTRSTDLLRTRPRAYVTREARCTVEGTAGDDVLTGTSEPDVICAGAGDDVVEAGEGHDIVRLGTGRDRAATGPGIDVVVGGDGADQISGGDRRDLVLGGAGADEVWGEGGADELRGGSGRDRLLGGYSADLLVGGDGLDACRGGAGRDRLVRCESP